MYSMLLNISYIIGVKSIDFVMKSAYLSKKDSYIRIRG